MVDEASRLGSTSVRADAVLELAETGPGRVRIELTVDRPSGSELLQPGAHTGTVTLTGATFADGAVRAEIPTGTDVEIVPTGAEPSITVSARAELDQLPYGDRILVAVPHDDAQAVLIAVPATAEADARTSATGPSPLPFQPVVSTVTSAPEAAPGAQVHDRLSVTVDTAEGLLPAWGVRTADDGFEPIQAVVASTLHGPFADPISEAPTVPGDAPIVCTVTTTVSGTGEYETPPCTLPSAGYYVWTERIDPSDVPADGGAGRIRPWQSAFGVASEVTLAAAPVEAPPAPAAPEALANTGADHDGGGAVVAGVLVGSGIALAALARVVRRRRRPAHRRA
jgi:hypothetical protein